MPLVEGRIYPYSDEIANELAKEITGKIVEQLKTSFSAQLGFTGEKEPVAQEVIGRFAPGWVWVYIEEFKGIVAGNSPKQGETYGRFDIILLENSLDEIYQNLLVDVVADAARQVLRSKQDRPNLAIANITGNVRMSVPGHPDNLLTAEGVHSFLTSEIKKELERMF
jgi:hypothetical protein